MKISICTNHFYPLVGGSEIVTKNVADFMLESGHSVSVFCRRHLNRSKTKYNIVEYDIGDKRKFYKYIDETKPDILFVYSDLFDFFQDIMLKKLPCKVILAPCGSNWVYKNRNYLNTFKNSVRNFAHIICHSSVDRDYTLCNDIAKDRLSIIPNGVDIGEFDTNTLNRSDLAPDIVGKKWILNISNFFPGKGQKHIPEILSKIPNNDLVYIQIANELDYSFSKVLEAEWLSAVKSSSIDYRLYKNLSRDKVVGFLKQSNLFLFTSEKEVAPLVLLESMAAVLPWLSTNVGNATELMGGKVVALQRNADSHCLFDDYYYCLFAKNISSTSCIDASDGRKQIEDIMNWQKVLPKYLEVFNKCLSS